MMDTEHGGERRKRHAFGDRARFLFLGVIFIAIGLAVLAVFQFRAQMTELDTKSSELHRLASQRAGQHDAHLTALSAIAVAGAVQNRALFLDVAASIAQFYPRIDETHLVPLDPVRETIGTTALPPDVETEIRSAAERSSRKPELLLHPSRAQHYLAVKRSPNSDSADYALALSVDAKQLLESDAAFWEKKNVAVRLSLPDGTSVVTSADTENFQFSQPLESASQPLLMEAGIRISLGDLLPPLQAVLTALIVGLVYFSAAAVVRQRSRLRAAEHETGIRRMEAKLTHASRVNALGELASGMAHELTQPLTAILAQAQAGRRLLTLGDTDRLAASLSDTVTQAKRASAILERLQNWSRPQRAPVAAINLQDALRNVQAIMEPEARRRGVTLDFNGDLHPVMILADQVEMEQVIHNIVRNAFEALDGHSKGKISIRLGVDADFAVVEISDNGPGVSKEVRSKLFMPFMTTRKDGTGLGLALSQRLIERAGGTISYSDGKPGGIFRIALPLCSRVGTAAQ